MDERMQIVARRLAGEAMAELRSVGISRKTGYKIFNRCQEYDIQLRIEDHILPRTRGYLEARHG